MVANTPSVISALITPMDEGREVDVHALEKLVEYEIGHGADGFYCCGSSGEGLLLSPDERKLVVDTVASVTEGKVPFYAHTGSLGTREAIDLSVHAQKRGAQAVSLIPPIYYNYSQAEVEQYYADVADSVDIGVIVYNIPQFTGISFSKDSAIMSNENIVGIKHTSMNLYDLERLGQAFPDKTLFNGFDEIYLYSLTAGAQSTIGTTVNVCPKLFKAIRDDFIQGDIEKAQEKQHLLNTFVESLVQEGIFPAVKYAMTYLGASSGPCRKPFKPLEEEGKRRVELAVKKLERYL
ncbi:dihydrodipicolinate synthase family protein [uncultured Sphaerochaeta sp.]|uniref:dihydrodipicolinate synthase family protein n=1 Tax=uncultured Sphaerochaeta sp. TaxID=886478 RepID=UPI0029C9BABC|nr:dihydrodipicolinate synthase family protein [uncultured Sphaerochaeta sp.]